jgi:CRP/FNR family transcriptional regulator
MTPVEALTMEMRDCYPSLREIPTPLLSAELTGETLSVCAFPGDLLFEEGTPCRGFPLVLEGEVCVSKRSADGGRAMELYRVTPGEMCVVSASSLLSQRDLNAQGIAAKSTRLVMLSPQLFERLTVHPAFRKFVFGVFSERLSDLMILFDAIAFHRLDQRLADHLLGHGQCYRTTHQALADELGTVREIITRLLNRFEAAGYIRLGRERIDVLDPASLRAVADGPANST